MKIITACILFIISFMCYMLDLVGMHGHVMIRANMTEDWIIWPIGIISFFSGIIFLIMGLASLNKSKN